MVARAFAPLPNRGAAGASSRRRQAMPVFAGAAFVVLVYLAFTRGLDLPLPEGAFQAWMR